MMSQSSTVTVVLLRFEALVVVFVADVVLAVTYPARHLDHKEAKDVESRHHYSASLGEIQLMCLSQTSNNSHLCHKRGTAVVLLALVVLTIEVVVF